MQKRLFLLFSISLLAFGLVSLVIVSASAGSLAANAAFASMVASSIFPSSGSQHP